MDWVSILDLVARWIVVPLGAYFVQRWLKDTKNDKEEIKRRNRANDIKAIAEQGFLFVEALEKTGKISKGTAKWTKFVEYVTTAMLATGLGGPSGKEMSWLNEFASGKAAHEKLPVKRP